MGRLVVRKAGPAAALAATAAVLAAAGGARAQAPVQPATVNRAAPGTVWAMRFSQITMNASPHQTARRNQSSARVTLDFARA